MHYNLPLSLEILERTPAVIATLLNGLSDEWTQSDEGPDTWSPYDIVGHFIHGEKTDWIPRMRMILGPQPDKRFVPFDRFAQFRDSEGKTLRQLLDEFAALRATNIAELRNASITEDMLERKGIHPAFGEVTLRQLLASWVVHDLGHIAQIARVMARQYTNAVGPWIEYLPVLTR